jgi:hypothetical protein
VLKDVLAQDKVEETGLPQQRLGLRQLFTRQLDTWIVTKAMLEDVRACVVWFDKEQSLDASAQQSLAERSDPGSNLGRRSCRGPCELVKHPVG